MRPNLTEQGSPMESYVGLDVHGKRSAYVIEGEDGEVVAREEPVESPSPTSPHAA